MVCKLDTEYTGDEFLDEMDELVGAAMTLENRTDQYTSALNNYDNDETSEHRLKNKIQDVEGSLEILYDALDSVDELIEEETLVAYIEKEDKKNKINLDKLFSQKSHGISHSINNFDDLVTVSHYLNDIGTEADERYLQPHLDTGAPTRMVAEKNRILNVDGRINDLYERIASNEKLARENTESDETRKTYSPEPPIFRMLGHEEHASRINRLNEKFKRKR
ncbi:MAG: hypothetical protein BRC29_03760 [Nanohaloarchaea archaeon SW_7_43_1]|nr:MAG: hypothetical protein BRC29_03760 [Nanohaloarchaea archaeon SW_7_43_1]